MLCAKSTGRFQIYSVSFFSHVSVMQYYGLPHLVFAHTLEVPNYWLDIFTASVGLHLVLESVRNRILIDEHSNTKSLRILI